MPLKENIQLQFQTITTEQLVVKDHPYRKVLKVFNFKPICREFRRLYSDKGAPGYEIEQGVKALILQFMEDYSDRDMERAIDENVAVKWFCGFELLDKTPDFTYFSKHALKIKNETNFLQNSKKCPFGNSPSMGSAY
ncbi:MAG: transposase [Bdellovibrionota bacterium]